MTTSWVISWINQESYRFRVHSHSFRCGNSIHYAQKPNKTRKKFFSYGWRKEIFDQRVWKVFAVVLKIQDNFTVHLSWIISKVNFPYNCRFFSSSAPDSFQVYRIMLLSIRRYWYLGLIQTSTNIIKEYRGSKETKQKLESIMSLRKGSDGNKAKPTRSFESASGQLRLYFIFHIFFSCS